MKRKKEFLSAVYTALRDALPDTIKIFPHVPEIDDVHDTYVWFIIISAQEQALGDTTNILFDINILSDSLNEAMDLESMIYAVLHRQSLSLTTATNLYVQALSSAYFTEEIAGIKKIRYVITFTGRVIE